MKKFIKTLIILVFLVSCSTESGTQYLTENSVPYPPHTAVINMPKEGGEKLITIQNNDTFWDYVSLNVNGNYDANDPNVNIPTIEIDEETRNVKGSWFSLQHTANPHEMLVKIEPNKKLGRVAVCDVFGGHRNETKCWHLYIYQSETPAWTNHISVTYLKQDTLAWVHNNAGKWDRMKCTVIGDNSEVIEKTFDSAETPGNLKGPWFTIEKTGKADEVRFILEPFDDKRYNARRNIICDFYYQDDEDFWQISVTQWGKNMYNY